MAGLLSWRPGREPLSPGAGARSADAAGAAFFRLEADGTDMTDLETAGSRPPRFRERPPRLVYDDDCGFCTWCAEYAAERGEFELVGFADLTADQRARLPDDYEECAHLLTMEEVYSCGEAIEETLARVETPSRFLARAFRRLPGSERIRESLYREVADRRALFGQVASRTPPARTRGGGPRRDHERVRGDRE